MPDKNITSTVYRYGLLAAAIGSLPASTSPSLSIKQSLTTTPSRAAVAITRVAFTCQMEKKGLDNSMQRMNGRGRHSADFK